MDNIIARIPVEEILNMDSFEVISKYYFKSKISFIKKNCIISGKERENCYLKTNSLDCLQVSIGKACNHNCIMCYAAEQHKHYDRLNKNTYIKILNDIKNHKLNCIYLTDIGNLLYIRIL